jgi:hypothetical protein
MAESLVLNGPQGPVKYVESTEWSTHPDYQGNGLAPANLSVVNAQVLHAGPDSIVGAETNLHPNVRADLIGNRVGFSIPPRNFAAQILKQNVRVGDGEEPTGLRDFSFMYLPQLVKDIYYSADDRQKIMEMVLNS